MKQEKILLVSVAIAATAFFAGCATGQTAVPATQNPQTQNPSSNTTTAPNSLADNTTYAGAIQLKDPKACEKLSTPDLQQACKIQIETMVAEQKKDEADMAQLVKNQKIDEEIMKSGDLARCGELSTSGGKFSCEVNILTQQAFAGDKIACQKGSTPDIVKACEQGSMTK